MSRGSSKTQVQERLQIATGQLLQLQKDLDWAENECTRKVGRILQLEEENQELIEALHNSQKIPGGGFPSTIPAEGGGL